MIGMPFEPRQTRIIVVGTRSPKEEDIAPVAEAAREGNPVVFPTDTVYGIGTNAFMPGAVMDLFRAKERPTRKPLILLIAEPGDVDQYVAGVNELARELIKDYWPGPLTLIFKKSAEVPGEVTAGGDTVGVRCPDNLIARALIRLAGVPLATTSANLAGQPSPKNAGEALRNLQGRVQYIIDGGEARLGVESTVLDISSDRPKLIREGFIPWAELEEKFGFYE